jgi:hypothetical protein
MNYLEINKAILEGRDVEDALVEKDKQFYEYLFNNKVAYYYATELSATKTEEDLRIIDIGNNYNDRYKKTLLELNRICREGDIRYLLFKTYRYFPSAVDGDIDILVKEDQFDKFLEICSKNGFSVVVDEPGKGKCEKAGFAEIEPHCRISWRSGTALDGDMLWQNSFTFTVDGEKVFNCSHEVELLALVGEIFFSPEYIDLHTLKKYHALERLIDINRLESFNVRIGPHLRLFAASATKLEASLMMKLPYFYSTRDLFKLHRSVLSAKEIVQILVFNTYWKYRYSLIDKLPFTHEWK